MSVYGRPFHLLTASEQSELLTYAVVRGHEEDRRHYEVIGLLRAIAAANGVKLEPYHG